MEILSILLTIAGLCLFETITSIDNAIINAEVLSTMSQKARRWFLIWGLLFAVFVIRGVLPWLIVWASAPSLGPVGALTATFSSDPAVVAAIAQAAPILLVGGGTFLIFLFLHWIFLEEKEYGICGERYIATKGVWFFAVVSIFLAGLVWLAISKNPMMAFGAVVGSSAFFIVHGFRQNAEEHERKMVSGDLSDISKIFYLEIIDATFSIDGVMGAFAFTMAVPLIIIGNGIGALIVRELTVRNVDTIRNYRYLKNGAMYSILILGIIMILDGFGAGIPEYVSPIATFGIVGYFLYRSIRAAPPAGTT
ncbi:protein of unknown function DUF475 [Methanoregula boonei 6A8]|uniref:Integral membrane protein TerC n=1 Tax=Methanoregula boonei (strain DSM 21154 / JCM 14090 / 6A8) TaxID=456442 RepID=A7I8T5_METB6|nr:DUF475 domain-containing protein [Methanoregula boonei]ABS56146.1 protein of unknown function DUF475 [Methanoregula boonei 6A8]